MRFIAMVIFILVSSLLLVACGGVEAKDPDSVSFDTMDLPYSGQANLVEATDYDDSQPPGPMGLPEHVQVNFGVTDPAEVQFGDPIIYIIPTEEYRQLWDEAGKATSKLPVLPFEAYKVMGAGNLGIVAQPEYLDMPWGSGIRFVATPMQGIDVILNRNLIYIEQGLTDDGEYLVSFIYPPVSTSELPDSIEEVTEEEMQGVNSDWATYREEIEDTLNSLSASDWEPDLVFLDEVISSLQFGSYGR